MPVLYAKSCDMHIFLNMTREKGWNRKLSRAS